MVCGEDEALSRLLASVDPHHGNADQLRQIFDEIPVDDASLQRGPIASPIHVVSLSPVTAATHVLYDQLHFFWRG